MNSKNISNKSKKDIEKTKNQKQQKQSIKKKNQKAVKHALKKPKKDKRKQQPIKKGNTPKQQAKKAKEKQQSVKNTPKQPNKKKKTANQPNNKKVKTSKQSNKTINAVKQPNKKVKASKQPKKVKGSQQPAKNAKKPNKKVSAPQVPSKKKQDVKSIIAISDRTNILKLCLMIEGKCKQILCSIFDTETTLVDLPTSQFNNKEKFKEVGMKVIMKLNKHSSQKHKNLHKSIYSLYFNDVVNWFKWLDSSKINKLDQDNINKLERFCDLRNELSHISTPDYNYDDLITKAKLESFIEKNTKDVDVYKQIKSVYTQLDKSLDKINNHFTKNNSCSCKNKG